VRAPTAQGSHKRQGDPVADRFAFQLYENRALFTLADGCNWGYRPKEAARRACSRTLDFLRENMNNIRDVQEACHFLLESFSEAQKHIMAASDDAGTTTLLAGMIVEEAHFGSLGESCYGFVCASVGDCKAYLIERASGEVIPLTGANRGGDFNPADCGGRLGPCGPGGAPDLRNLSTFTSPCQEGDLILLLSDGVHDNLDPSQLGLEPADLDCSFAQWGSDQEAAAQVKSLFRSRLIEHWVLAGLDEVSPRTVVDRALHHAKSITARSREIMEKHPSLKQPRDYRVFPGKMDHTTAMCFRVGPGQPKLEEELSRAQQEATEAQACMGACETGTLVGKIEAQLVEVTARLQKRDRQTAALESRVDDVRALLVEACSLLHSGEQETTGEVSLASLLDSALKKLSEG
jgi:Protein phosphatase 2C